MATATKIFVENEVLDASGNVAKSTWTANFTGSNVTANGSTVTLPLTITAKYVKQSAAKKDSAYAQFSGKLHTGDNVIKTMSFEKPFGKVNSGVTFTVPRMDTTGNVCNTGDIFNSTNASSKTVTVSFSVWSIDLQSYYADGAYNSWYYYNGAYVNMGNVSTVTLNAPPTFNAEATSTAPYYANYTRYTVNLTDLSPKYGATATAVLRVGDQTASRTTNGELSILLNATGTFTPSVTVTDSRGQVTPLNLPEITVATHTTPTVTTEETSTAPYYTTGTSYSVTTSNATLYDDTTIASITLNLGSQSVSDTEVGTLTLTHLDEANDFVPTVTITDSVGASYTTSLPRITVNQYSEPSMNVAVSQRTEGGTSKGKPNEEQTSAVIGYQLVWKDAIGHIQRPRLYIDGSTTEATVTWYKSYNSSTAPYLSNEITNWDTISSGDTVYAFFSDTFPIANSYTVYAMVSDDYETSKTLAVTIAQAFFTIDFLAGGHGIAFGQLATEEGFDCAMPAKFVDMTTQEVDDFSDSLDIDSMIDVFYPVGSYYETSNTAFDPNTSWGGTWVLEMAGQVHVSAGTGYSVSGANGADGVGTSDGGSPYIQAHTHGFTNPSVPNHTHAISGKYFVYSDNSAANNVNITISSSGTSRKVDAGTNSSSNVFHHAGATSATGACTTTGGSVGAVSGVTTGNKGNMQPFIVVNRWHRTA